MTTRIKDLVFVGAGVSATFTLINILDALSSLNIETKINIAVFEKNENFWSGIPYGQRSGNRSLIITKLADFIPVAEKDQFVNWIINNRDRLCQTVDHQDNRTLHSWLSGRIDALNIADINEMYVPRHWFGEYINNKIMSTINNDSIKNKFDLKLINQQVTNITKDGKIFKIYYGDNNDYMNSEAVVLTNGGLSNKYLNISNISNIPKNIIIQDPYSPSLPINLEKIHDLITSKNNQLATIAIIGSNASSLELLYHLSNDMISYLKRIYIISKSGSFPYLIDNNIINNFDYHHMRNLSNEKSFTSAELISAARNDIDKAKSMSIPVTNIIDGLSQLLFKNLERLSKEEQSKFVHHDGMKYVGMIRRAGINYLGKANNLIELNKLVFIKGEFKSIHNECDQMEIIYNSTTDLESDSTVSCDIVINCMGFENIYESNIPLIKNLLCNNLIKSNDSKRGVEVNERFEASENMFVLGPLLAGNHNKVIRLWHAESASRMHNLASKLATVLLELI